jgi:ComF family protein
MKLLEFVENQVDSLFQLVYPPVCICCEGIFEGRNDLKVVCNSCIAQLEAIPRDYIQTEILQRLDVNHLDNLFCVFKFNEIIQTVIHIIKYQKGKQLAFRLGRYSRNFSQSSFSLPEVDLIIPVPLYGGREKERGFNQSLMIAKGFFLSADLSIESQLLLRKKSTRSQTEMGREERITNVEQAFFVPYPHKTKRKRMLLIDDVVTTGATLNECAFQLKKAGAAVVYGLTIATPLVKEREILD